VYIVVTPTAAASSSEPVVTAVFEVGLEREPPTPRPTFDVASIPSLDRPPEPTPRSRAEQAARCLSFSAETFPQPGLSGLSQARARVRARNSCNAWIPAEDTGFEIVSIGAARGAQLGREVGQFQDAIAPFASNAETWIGVDCPENLPGGCRYIVTALVR
jgi:hypothetical protein